MRNELLRALLQIGVVQDYQMDFANAANVAGSISAANYSTNVLDYGVSNPDTGAGTPVWLTLQIITSIAPTASAAGTITWIVEHSDDNTTFYTLMTSKAYALSAAEPARATPGFKVFNQPLPVGHKRYLRIARTIAGQVITAGTYDAFLHLGGMPKD